VPRLVEALAGKTVVGATAGACYTAVWTVAGELFTFWGGDSGRLGHGCGGSEGGEAFLGSVGVAPRLVEALAGKAVVGVSVVTGHTAVQTDSGEIVTFGEGRYGQLGHGEVGNGAMSVRRG
jgi:alpha-tubulin suppressor-like RCC1 family protein